MTLYHETLPVAVSLNRSAQRVEYPGSPHMPPEASRCLPGAPSNLLCFLNEMAPRLRLDERCLPDAPRCLPDAPRSLQMPPRCLPDAPSSLQMPSRCPPDVPRCRLHAPQMLPDVPQMPPDVPRCPPQMSPRPPMWYQRSSELHECVVSSRHRAG